ncbi:MAG: RsmE family RNA methyltransferase [bacterium]
MSHRPWVVAPPPDQKGRVIVGGEEAHHLIKVLRLKRGDRFIVISGTGPGWEVEAEEVTRSLVKGRAIADVPLLPLPIHLTLGAGMIKGARMDWLVEKCGEIGVRRLIPLITRYGVVEPRTGKINRWRNLAIAAAKQAHNPVIMEVTEPVKAIECLSALPLTPIWSLDPYAPQPLIPQILSGDLPEELILLIGPEGGWSDEEKEAIRARGGEFFRLGETILRTETAAVVTAGIILLVAHASRTK